MGKIDRLKKRDAKYLKLKKEGMRMFVASKRGGNAKGKGALRSVVLCTMDGKTWFQHAKFWGADNEEQAANYVRWFNNLKDEPKVMHTFPVVK